MIQAKILILNTGVYIMEKVIEQKKFKSIIQRIIRFPLIIFTIIMLFTVALSIFSFYTMQERMIDSNVNLLQISMNQLDNQLTQIDEAYVSYWNDNQSFKNLRRYAENTPREAYLTDWVAERNWQKGLMVSFGSVQGACAYYSNIDSMIFTGGTRYSDAHLHIREWVRNGEGPINCWQLVDIEGERYLINIKNYGTYYGAVWILYSEIENIFSLASDDFMGTVYLIDSENRSSLDDPELTEVIVRDKRAPERLKTTRGNYYNFQVSASIDDLSLGILIPARMLYSGLPWASWLLIGVTLFSVLLIPIYILWLQKKIAIPFTMINQGVQRIGEGDMEYRMEIEEKKTYDEFDRLVLQLNAMMDQLNELEFNLYKSKIKEQQTELKYISQQIRPHFMLNALNVIYTYNESEFPLVKEMILYLTQYFRYIVNLRVDFVEVEKEFHHVENYLKIQKMRYGERFDFMVQWRAQAKEMLIPPLILQTFVENCIKYGMKSDGVLFICVLAGIENHKLKLTVSDTGNGFSEEKLQQIYKFIETREYSNQLGVGIQNAIERMDILYDGDVEIKISNVPSGGSLIEIYLPTKE